MINSDKLITVNIIAIIIFYLFKMNILINDLLSVPIKRYLTTDLLTTNFPPDFIYSKNKKYVEIVNVNIFINDSKIDDDINAFHQPKYISMHGDFVQDRRDLDSFVQFANMLYPKRKKYEQLSQQRDFTIWFKDICGTVLNARNLTRIDDHYVQIISPTHKRKIKFVLELLLVY